jgi:serine/threonine-protein kinase HipA
MTVLGEGRSPTREHVLRLATQFDIKRCDSAAVLDQVNDAIENWPPYAGQAACAKKAAKVVSSHLRAL